MVTLSREFVWFSWKQKPWHVFVVSVSPKTLFLCVRLFKIFELLFADLHISYCQVLKISFFLLDSTSFYLDNEYSSLPWWLESQSSWTRCWKILSKVWKDPRYFIEKWICICWFWWLQVKSSNISYKLSSAKKSLYCIWFWTLISLIFYCAVVFRPLLPSKKGGIFVNDRNSFLILEMRMMHATN